MTSWLSFVLMKILIRVQHEMSLIAWTGELDGNGSKVFKPVEGKVKAVGESFVPSTASSRLAHTLGYCRCVGHGWKPRYAEDAVAWLPQRSKR